MRLDKSHLRVPAGSALLPPRQGWEILPDQRELGVIADEIVALLRSQIQRRADHSEVLQADLQQVILKLPNERIYEALVAVRGKSVPRYNCGDIADITVPLREELTLRVGVGKSDSSALR